MRTDEEILQEIARIARQHLGWTGGLSGEMRLVEDLDLDSLRLLTLAVEVENLFRVCLDEQDEQKIDTVADLVRAVRCKMGAEG